MAPKPIKRLRLDDHLVSCLEKNNIITTECLVTRSDVELMDALSLCLPNLQGEVGKVWRRVAPSSQTAWELLESENSDGYQPTLLPLLDLSINGGLKAGTITEVAGPAGAGKTQLMMWFAAATVSQHPTASVLYIDTEGSFAASRFREFVMAQLKASGNQDNLEEAVMNATARAHVLFITSISELSNTLQSPEVFSLMTQQSVRLIVIDSVAKVTLGFDDSRQILLLLGNLAAILKKLGALYNCPVVVTNHISSFGRAPDGN